jgi:hypothetical protein
MRDITSLRDFRSISTPSWTLNPNPRPPASSADERKKRASRGPTSPLARLNYLQRQKRHDLSQHLPPPALSQHLQKLRQSLLKPIKMMMTEMAIHMVLPVITSRLNSNTITPIRMMNTPHILWQKQPHFLVSQHFFSSVVSMMDFLSWLSVCVAGVTSEINHAAAAFEAARSALRSLRLLKNS